MPIVNADKTTTERDRVFAECGARGKEPGAATEHGQDLVDFVFDDRVAQVFPDMIRRSVPGYDAVVPLTGLIAAKHLPAGGRCYDLGCSLGAASHAVLRSVADMPCEIVAVDNSEAMLRKARAIHAKTGGDERIRWLRADVRDVPLENAAVVVLNYTLQFLPHEDRLPLLRRIRGALADSGVLLLSEKLAAGDYFQDLHLRFKRANGYSELEIARKRDALENVMRIDSEDAHLERLRTAGFARAEVWFRCLNWGAFAAWPN